MMRTMANVVIDEHAAFGFRYGGWIVVDADASIIDRFRTHPAADHYAHLLNIGAAHVNPHGLIGCRVEVNHASS